MKNKNSDLSDPERKRIIAKKTAIRSLGKQKRACKSIDAITSANQKKRESNVTPPINNFRITPRMLKILQLLKTVPVLPHAQKILKRDSDIPRTTFYRLIKQLENMGFISHIPNSYPKMEKIHPDIIFLLSQNPEGNSRGGKVGKQSSPRKTIQNGKSTRQKRDSEVDRNPIDFSHRENSSHSEVSPRDSKGNKQFDDKIQRSHNYFFKIPIQRKPAYLDRMLTKTKWFEQKQMRNWNYFQGKLSMFGCEAIIQFNPNVVTVWLNNIFGRDPFVNDQEANRRILEIKGFLEDSYAGLYLAPAQFLRRVENKGTHQAWIHHNLALKAKQQNLSLRGKNWEVDSSKDMPELEAFNELKASEHLSEELEDYDYRSEEKIYFRDIHSNQKKHLEIIEEIQRSQIQLAGGMMTNFQITESALRSNAELNEKLKKWPREFYSVKLSPLQIEIKNFISSNPGLNRKTISENTGIKIGSINGTIVQLKKVKIIREINSQLFPKL
jgi:DNA-binding MarR family transcriptional regulator